MDDKIGRIILCVAVAIGITLTTFVLAWKQDGKMESENSIVAEKQEEFELTPPQKPQTDVANSYFNEDGKYRIAFMQVDELKELDEGNIQMTGMVWTYPDVIPSMEEEKRLSREQRVNVFGIDYIAQGEYVEGYYSGQLFADENDTEPAFKLISLPYLMNYPSYMLYDAKSEKEIIVPFSQKETVIVKRNAEIFNIQQVFCEYISEQDVLGKYFVINLEYSEVTGLYMKTLDEVLIMKGRVF